MIGDPYKTVQDELQGRNIETVSIMSGVSKATLYNWRNEITKRPQFFTLKLVLEALGYEINVKKVRRKMRSVG